MATYIGKRIVPVHCGKWDKSKAYEMLSIVLEETSGDSYIARRAVPTGTAITDTYYWMLHSLYSQQIKDMSDQLTAAEQRIKADNDATEAAIRADNQATATHIDEAIGAARADLDQKWAAADTDMRTVKCQFEQTADTLTARMNSIIEGSTDGSDVEVADARINYRGYSHETLGNALRYVDEKVGISLDKAGLLDAALTNGGVVFINTEGWNWKYGTLNPSTGGLDEESTQVIRTKDYIRLPASAKFTLDSDFRIRICAYQRQGDSFVFVSGCDWLSEQRSFHFDPDLWYMIGLYSPTLKSEITLAHARSLVISCAYLTEEFGKIQSNAEQISTMNAAVKDLKGMLISRRNGTLDSSSDCFEVWDYYYASDGGGISEYHHESMNFTTYTMTATEDFDCYFDELLSSYTSITPYTDAIYDREHYTHRYRHYANDNDLPSKDNPLHVEKGTGIAISIFRERNFHLYLKHSMFGYEFGEIHLAETQTDEVETLVDSKFDKALKHCMVRYSPEGTGLEHTTEHLDIYIPAAVGYLHYEFGRCVNLSTNADNWRISMLYSVDDDLHQRYGITQRGEWEMAITLKGRPDFIGGIAHGDEVVKSIALYVDGKKTSMENLTELTTFTELRIVEQTKLFDPNDSVTHVADHGKEYIFDASDLHLRQTVKWLLDEELGTSYMLMFPVYRGNDEASALQVTDHFYANDDYSEYDVSIGGDYDSEGYGWRRNVTMATIYSEKSGFCGTVEMIEQPELVGGGSFMVQRTLNSYNKLYWSIAGTSDGCTVKAGDRWYVHARYQFQVSKGTDIE